MFSSQFVSVLWENLLAYLVGRLFLTGGRGAAIRRWGMVVVGFLLWTWLALRLHPYAPNSEPVLYALQYPLRAYFAPDVFKHVLIAAVVFWLAYRAAAIYLDDIFELKNIRISERFIRQSAFGDRYDTIEILNGNIAEKDKNSPIFLIGGPGKARIYLENAALFEKIGGDPHVIGPTTGPAGDGVAILEGFERLRNPIDLRDHVATLSVKGRTRDGLRIQVEDVKAIFSVLRNGQEATLQTPYPFDPEALQILTYNFPTQNWRPVMTSQIQRKLGRFISQHTLSEFLAAVGPPEAARLEEAEARLSEMANLMAGIDETPAVLPLAVPPFVARPEIRGLFYDLADFVPDAAADGVELRWIGLGTWVLPDEIIPEHHLQAWRISAENLGRGSPAALGAVFQASRAEQLHALVADTPLSVFEGLNTLDPALNVYNMARLVSAYRAKLEAALQAYQRQGMGGSPGAEQVEMILNYLFNVVAYKM